MSHKWLVERASIWPSHICDSLESRLDQLDKTHEIVSVTPDPHEPGHVVIVAKLRPVGYDA